MIKDYKILFKKYRKSLFNYYDNSFFTSVYRVCGILIFPFLKNINPNLISFISLLLGVLALFLSHFYKELSLSLIAIFFLSSFILDFSDGIVARYQKKTSFNGRFMDGLFDIIVGGILHIILFVKITNLNSNIHEYFYLVTILLCPMQHLVMDRYSAMARWINEINHKKKFKPYYRNDFLGKYAKIFYDSQHFCIWLLILGIIDYKIIIEIFFVLSFLASILSLGIHLFLSYKNFSSIANQKDNYEK